jgi:hypothetical protein
MPEQQVQNVEGAFDGPALVLVKLGRSEPELSKGVVFSPCRGIFLTQGSAES